MSREEYLEKAAEQIRCKKAREAVREELEQHIEDQTEAFMEEGMPREKAEASAVEEMGDPVESGGALDKIHRPKMAWGTMGIIGVLGLAGVLTQYLLQLHAGPDSFQPVNLGKQMTFLLISFGVMILVCYVDYSRIGAYGKLLTVILCVGVFLGERFLGTAINGRTSWILYFSGISVNLSAADVLLVPLYGGILYDYYGKGYTGILRGVLWMLPGIILAWSSRGINTVAVLFLSFAVMLSLAVYKDWFRVSKKTVLAALWGSMLLLPVIIGALFFRYGASYQQARLQAAMGMSEELPWSMQYLRNLAEGCRLVGAGSESMAAETDLAAEYVLAHISFYYGAAAGILLAGAILLLICHFYRVSFRQRNQLGMMMGTGCATVFLTEVVLYVLGNLGLISVSVYCPFLTYGGSQMLVTFVLLGLMLSIYRYENVVTDKKSYRRNRIFS